MQPDDWLVTTQGWSYVDWSVSGVRLRRIPVGQVALVEQVTADYVTVTAFEGSGARAFDRHLVADYFRPL